MANFLKHIELLMKDNYGAVGFIPMSRIEKQNERGLVFHQKINGEWAGYMVVGTIKYGRRVHIWQECIDKSARGAGSGKQLYEKLEIACIASGVEDIVLNCADDLPSNLFWQAMGFEKVLIKHPKNKRKRAINTYRKILKGNLFEIIK